MRFWGLLLVVLLVVLVTPRAKAQTSSNILTPTVSGWVGSVLGQNGGYSGGGNGPAYNPNTNTLIFGYTTATATQTITAEAFAIQQALNLSNSGIRINGYNYSWWINNSGSQSGTLTGQVDFLRGGTSLRTDIYNYNSTTNGFELRTGTQTFATQESMLAGDSMTLSFTGQDNRFWAGYYGPQVRSPSITLNYTTDPCVSNPAYSPSCPNYNTLSISNNLFSGTTGSQAFAINQALANAGAGAMIHGFNYGYDYNVAGRYCSIFDFFGGFCITGWNYSDAGVGVAITSSNGTVLESTSHTQNGNDNGAVGTFSRQFRFNSSLPRTALGGFAMSPWTSGNASITNMYSNAVYTPDPCLDPLSSPSCPGYAAAYFTQQCTANPLYNSSCPGYAQAYFTQQCTVNALYDPSCPGYASAYLTYQCSINPLYSTTCAGYAEAYKTQQCALDGLYDRTCTNYAEAYAKKNILTTDTTSTTTKTTSSTPTSSTVSKTEASTTISSDGAVKTEVSKTGDSNIDKAIDSPTTTTNTAAAPSAPVQLVAPAPAPSAPTQTAKMDGPAAQKSEDKKDDAPKGAGGGSQSQNTTASSSDKPAAPTARQALQERREAAAKASAVEKGKNLANEMGKATDMESQKQIQNVVIQAMGFTPGFDAYGKAVLQDAAGYKPYAVYTNQKNIENRSTLRMFGGTDRIHNEMINSQYQLGK